MINKELSNDQRTRLEQIAKDEFNIRRREIGDQKSQAFNSWIKSECDKMKKSAMAKKYEKLLKEQTAIKHWFYKMGFVININMDGSFTLHMATSNGFSEQSKQRIHPKYAEKQKANQVNQDVFTRGLNKVLSVIWSMEKPFSECIALINEEVKNIK
jgi:hypothetical protein